MNTGAQGWHPDPSGRFEQRYFDGVRWTEHVASQGQVGRDPLAVPAEASAHRGGSITAVAGAAAVAAGAFMPWARVWIVSASGIDGGDGWITLVLALLGGALAIAALREAPSKVHIGTIITGVLAGLVGIIDLADVMSEESAEVGIGLWATVAGAIAMVVGGWVGMAKATRQATLT